jgi:hypothetical protein
MSLDDRLVIEQATAAGESQQQAHASAERELAFHYEIAIDDEAAKKRFRSGERAA